MKTSIAVATAALAPGNVFAADSSLVITSENQLFRSVDPSIWVSWAKGNFPNPEGATDKNSAGYLQVGFQYHTFNLVPYALVNRSKHFLDGVCSIVEYAFRHQAADGTFPYLESNGSESSGTATNPEAPPSSLTQFYYDLGHSLLTLSGDDWYQKSADCAPYRARLGALRPQMAVSLNWLLSQRALLATDRAASNRTFAHALAFYFMGKALMNQSAIDVGSDIARGAIYAAGSGVFPEAGGFDSSYQAFNVLECEWLTLHSDGALRDMAWGAVRRGLSREMQSIAPSGEVSTTGNTRVSQNGETFFNHRKTVNTRQVLLALAYYGAMASDANSAGLAMQVQKFYNLPTK